MAIKRVTIELDDAPEKNQRTSDQASFGAEKPTKAIGSETTDIPKYDESSDNETSSQSTPISDKTGRTNADLISEYSNSPRAMATILTVVAFALFSLKIDTFQDIWKPIVTAVVFNLVYFVIPLFQNKNK